MKMLKATNNAMSNKEWTNKKVLFAFSDPAGAKAMLALACLYKKEIQELRLVSDRTYAFFEEFELTVDIVSKANVKEVISNFNPDLLITGTSFPEKIELQFIGEAMALGIRSIAFIDHYTNMLARFRSLNGDLVIPDEIWVLDERAMTLAIKDGIPAQRLKTNSNPYHTYLSRWSPNTSREVIMEKLGIPAQGRYILYAPEPLSAFDLQHKYGFTEVEVLTDLLEVMAESELFLVLKLHPNQEISMFEPFRGSKRLRISGNYDLNVLAYYSELVCGFFSNSLMEAKVLNKTVFRTLHRLNDINNDPLKGLEIGNEIYQRQELKKILEATENDIH
jgi:predicted glycosyltransferase